MTGQDKVLSESDHIVRYVGKDNLNDDGSVSGGAFRKMRNEARPSVNWLEAFDGSKAEQVQRVRDVIRLNLGRFAKFAELNIGELVHHVLANGSANLRVLSVPLPATADKVADESRAEMDGFPLGDGEKIVCDLLAECVCDLHAARSNVWRRCYSRRRFA